MPRATELINVATIIARGRLRAAWPQAPSLWGGAVRVGLRRLMAGFYSSLLAPSEVFPARVALRRLSVNSSVLVRQNLLRHCR